ncbi:tripartite motif-containing protein 3-like [Anneissia japonica]|uniref:tripartite motif-containing protein 3-like n=1 Tax=Anneissia japonica TaxID=1529436 RepID=UPI001425890D|nr:tripartite motif-containing protein 3-like [Anneissia japonica]
MAEDSIRRETIDEAFLKCPIHNDRYERAKTLPCLHAQCLDCLEKSVHSNGGKLICAACQQEHIFPKRGIEELPNSMFLRSLINFIDKHGNGNLRSDRICMEPTFCLKHSNTEISRFCITCQEVVCSRCITVSHPADDHKLEDVQRSYVDKREEVLGLLGESREKIETIDTAYERVESVGEELRKNTEAAKSAVEGIARRLCEKVMKYRDELLRDIDRTCAVKKDGVDKQLLHLRNARRELSDSCEFADNLVAFGNHVTLPAEGTKTINRLEDLLSKKVNIAPIETSNLEFQINDEFEQDLRKDCVGRVGTTLPADPLKSKVENVSEKDATVGVELQFLVTLCDEMGTQIAEGGSDVVARMESADKSIMPILANDNSDGTYAIKFVPHRFGKIKVHATVFGDPVTGSPFEVNVAPRGGLAFEYGGSNGQLNQPRSVTTNSEGNYIISDRFNNRILIMNRNGEEKEEFTLEYDGMQHAFSPDGVAVTRKDEIVIADFYNHEVFVLDREGNLIRRFAKELLLGPIGIAVNSKGLIHVVDHKGRCLKVFTTEGVYIRTIGGEGTKPGKFRIPWFVAINSKDHIFVVDTGNARVQHFNDAGKYVHSFSIAYETKELKPRGIAIDGRDRIIVAGGNRISMYGCDGKLLKRIDKPEDGMSFPCGCTVTKDKPALALVCNGPPDGDKHTVKGFVIG